ncbi:MAG: alpha-amylase, partial [Acidobacteria bacterium]|nr:alpha-amylase [Acidobacteriota bacterium]
AGGLLALRLVAGFLHRLIDEYRRERDAEALEDALDWLRQRHGAETVSNILLAFRRRYLTSAEPDRGGGRGSLPPEEEALLLEDLLVLWALNENPAVGAWQPLFDDRNLEEETGYRELLGELSDFFEERPGFGPDDASFFELLQAPARAAPDSLVQQLGFLLRLEEPLVEDLREDLLLGMDVLREEQRPIFPGPGGGPPGPGPSQVLAYDEAEEPELFSPDRDWMPEAVLLAKNVYVWLDQLSRSYGRPIRHLDEIPERELDRIAGDGITALWLIGIWRRSHASERIKRLCGNPEAAASAYSIFDYHIDPDLGGDEALETLRRRAWQRRVRLACDMVPNHMGIDSRWVLERPELFLSVPRCPYPNYTFDGPDLSPDPQVGIFLEDHYYDRTDAAVVFKRLDRRSGEVSYLYHGNDGTGMPWNDTAQLDYLNPATREAVLEAILEVARHFPVIRFDAA